ncbi:hypothetical protein [Flavobacterium anhuiense]|uniref:hypothetical protein n=1 Tax=Flavobacterium anhuiense TaxID=459526 RepID=UPI0013C3EB83|nr:hypothetical protein [Flavobacterium anhuiense]
MRIIIISTLILFTFSCSSQKSKYQSPKNRIIESEDCNGFYKIYEKMDDGTFFTEELEDFSKMKNGVLFYRYQDGLEHGKLVVVEFQDEKNISYTRDNFQKKSISLPKKYENEIKEKINAFEKNKCYVETSEVISENNFYLMLVVKNKAIITQYQINGNLSFKKTNEKSDLENSKDLLEIMYRISFGNTLD